MAIVSGYCSSHVHTSVAASVFFSQFAKNRYLALVLVWLTALNHIGRRMVKLGVCNNYD